MKVCRLFLIAMVLGSFAVVGCDSDAKKACRDACDGIEQEVEACQRACDAIR
jgi:outer membrane murein-binding lipoprotein Lpp